MECGQIWVKSDARTSVRERGAFSRRKRRLTQNVGGPWLVPVIVLLFVLSTASVATVGLHDQRAEVQSSIHPAPVPPSILNGSAGTKKSVATPDTNTVVNVYDAVGYNGNSTIYPTEDFATFFLPLENSMKYQTTANSSLEYGGVANINRLNVSDLSYERPAYGIAYILENYYFVIQLWVTSTGGSNSTFIAVIPLGWANSSTDALNVQVAATGMPSGNSNGFEPGNNTGLNVTPGNMAGESGTKAGSLAALLGLGLDAASLIFPELIGVVLTATSIDLDLDEFTGPAGPTTNNQLTSIPVAAGSSPANQWELVRNGTITSQTSTTVSGQNVFSQTDMIQDQMPEADVSQVTPGDLTILAENQLVYMDASGNTYAVGANPSISYPIEPAISVGGVIDLWQGGPPLPGASSVIQQQFGSCQCEFQTNYETTNGAGYYHDFLNPDVWFTQAAATFSDPLGTASLGSNYCPSACSGYTNEIPIGAAWPGTNWSEGSNQTLNMHLNGGIVTGVVTSGGKDLSGATVELCDNQGCVSTQTNGGGNYSIDFPSPGTSSDPYSITVSDNGYITSTTSGLLLATGWNHENFGITHSPTYSVSFSESGLPSKYSWGACVGSTCESAAAGSGITFSGISGTNSYSVNSVIVSVNGCTVEYYAPSPSSGTVSGATHISVTYTLKISDDPAICIDPPSDGSLAVGSGLVAGSSSPPRCPRCRCRVFLRDRTS